MSNSIYITGMEPASGKSVVVLGVMELLARHGRKLGFFRPMVEGDASSDRLVALVTSRYDIMAPPENMFGATNAFARDLISGDKEDELHSRILEKYRGLAQQCDFVVCVGTDHKAMHTALEFEFNVEVARNLGAPLMPVITGKGRTVGEIVDAVSALAESLEAKKCDVLSVIVNRVAPEIGEFGYDTEGWGLCFDGKALIMSDGSERLFVRDPASFALRRSVRVTLEGRPVAALNELECVGDRVYANRWRTDEILRIDPRSGRVDAVIDARPLSAEVGRGADVLNGIAHRPGAATLYLAGKLWPVLFEVKLLEASGRVVLP